MNRMKNGQVIPLTAEEESAVAADRAAAEVERPAQEWQEQMQALDAELVVDVRMFEDLLDWAIAAGYTPPAGSKVTAAIAKRKAHRSTKP